MQSLNKSSAPRGAKNVINDAATRIRKLTKLKPSLALVLGSGFDYLLAKLRVEARVSYARIPGMPISTVPGHAGELLLGTLNDVPLLMMSGRAHYYEGHDLATVTFGVRLLAALGIQDLLLTNAAGGVNRKYAAGDFMVLRDHINFMGVNPLRGSAAPELPRFVDLTRAYDQNLGANLLRAAKKAGLRAHLGVYLAVSGPSYETPAEIRAFRFLGADAVGMSTVPEAIVARQLGLRVAAVSCITNLAAGITTKPLSHEEVLEMAQRVRSPTAEMLELFVTQYARSR